MLKGRPAGKPFFMMCHHKAPHRSWDPDPAIAAEYRKLRIPEPPALRDDYETRTDAIRQCRQKVFTDLTRRDLKLQPPQGLTPAERSRWLGVCPDSVETEVDGRQVTLAGAALDSWKYQRYMQDYLACVESIDRSVGRMLDYLETSGLARNTVVIYASDQGFFLGDHGLYDKRFMYEEALRMPFLVRWPGVTRPGSVQRRLAINPDFAPTFLDIAGLPTPPDMQGRSLRGLMAGRPAADWRRSFYYRYYHDPGDHNTRTHYGVRTETHKLIHFWRLDQWEMYDLRRDPHEMRNLAGRPGERRQEAALRDELYRLKRELGDDDRFADGKV
jgi:arylsulfatase A-like enzyme